MISLTKENKRSICDQIYDAFENKILTGLMPKGTEMPSIRSLSKSLEVSHMTVVKAYERLEKGKLIDKIQGRGSFVIYDNATHSTIHIPSQTEWKNKIQDYVVRAGFTNRIFVTPDHERFNLSIASLYKDFLPTNEIISQYLNHFNIDDLTGISPVEGIPKLLDVVSDFLLERGLEISPRQLIVTNGSQSGIHLIAQTYVGNGDVVVVEAPTFSGAIDVFRSRGAKIIEVPMTPDGIETDSLLMICENHPVKLLYTIPTFQNPTGIPMSLSTSKTVLELAHEHNFIILEDDAWNDLYYERAERPLKSLDTEGRVLYLIGLSKTLGPALKLSAIASEPEFRQKLLHAKSSIDSSTSLINQLMVASYLGTVEHQKHLVSLRHKLKQRLNLIRKHMTEKLPNYVKVRYPKGGLVIWFTLPHTFDCKMLYYRLLAEKGIIILLGEYCYSSIKGHNQFRICFSTLSEEDTLYCLDEIIDMIKSVYAMTLNDSRIPTS